MLDLQKAITARRESRSVEFKETFDPGSAGEWCELVKDIVAIANSGGGYLLFGVKRNGVPSGWDPKPVLDLDPAHITDKVKAYTGEEFSEFEMQEAVKSDQTIAIPIVKSVGVPMVFTQPGTYSVAQGKQKTAFSRGTVYFRHGAKSEPANSQDLRDCIEREVEHNRRSWLKNIRKVVNAPAGHHVSVLPPEVIESFLPTAHPIRIVDDPQAPAYRKIDPDQTHPFRQKEIVEIINQGLQGRKKITPYDVYCVRKVYAIDRNKPHFFYKSKFASPQYSRTFADWLVEEYERNPLLFDDARRAMKRK